MKNISFIWGVHWIKSSKYVLTEWVPILFPTMFKAVKNFSNNVAHGIKKMIRKTAPWSVPCWSLNIVFHLLHGSRRTDLELVFNFISLKIFGMELPLFPLCSPYLGNVEVPRVFVRGLRGLMLWDTNVLERIRRWQWITIIPRLGGKQVCWHILNMIFYPSKSRAYSGPSEDKMGSWNVNSQKTGELANYKQRARKTQHKQKAFAKGNVKITLRNTKD